MERKMMEQLKLNQTKSNDLIKNRKIKYGRTEVLIINILKIKIIDRQVLNISQVLSVTLQKLLFNQYTYYSIFLIAINLYFHY